MTYKTNEKEQKLEKVKKNNKKIENNLVCEFTESETYEEFRMRVSSKYGYSPKIKFLDPFYHHILRVENKKLYVVLENLQFFLAPVVFSVVLSSFCFSGNNGKKLSFIYIVTAFVFAGKNLSISIKIDGNEKWYHKYNEHLYSEEK